jgi:hypothetical protein
MGKAVGFVTILRRFRGWTVMPFTPGLRAGAVFLRFLAGIARPLGRPEAGATNYYFFSLGGLPAEAESLVISANCFWASSISEGCVATLM